VDALTNYTEEEEVILTRNLYRPRQNAAIEGVKIVTPAPEMAGVGVLLRYHRVMSVTRFAPLRGPAASGVVRFLFVYVIISN
jgi:hypothetical protein